MTVPLNRRRGETAWTKLLVAMLQAMIPSLAKYVQDRRAAQPHAPGCAYSSASLAAPVSDGTRLSVCIEAFLAAFRSALFVCPLP